MPERDKEGVLWEIEHWSMMTGAAYFWLNALLDWEVNHSQTFAERMFADGRLGASFFCSRDFEDRSNLQAISYPCLPTCLPVSTFQRELLQVLRHA